MKATTTTAENRVPTRTFIRASGTRAKVAAAELMHRRPLLTRNSVVIAQSLGRRESAVGCPIEARANGLSNSQAGAAAGVIRRVERDPFATSSDLRRTSRLLDRECPVLKEVEFPRDEA
jgi:hypothetical protein